ncbi:MAG: transglutaminase-like cysteine peptidase [Sulfurimonas sp.]|jgi:predicted transglutaminase-like cysteine proteinase|nr:transglutaminase-like cysteine peptidase [Sulfurimonadaceae bacterium]
MKKLILLSFLLLATIHAEFITNELIAKVEKQYKKFAKNRFVALKKLIATLAKATTDEKLEKVNNFFNFVGYGSDQDVYGVSDYWATPYEFLARDKGDCEDYVIAKYLTLEYLGIDTSKMFLSYVRVKGSDQAHMVLSYYETPSSEPLILDNLRKKIFPASQRDDLVLVYNFNPKLSKQNDAQAAHKKWNDLISNFKKEKM